MKAVTEGRDRGIPSRPGNHGLAGINVCYR